MLRILFHLLLLLSLFSTILPGYGQVQHGGRPAGWDAGSGEQEIPVLDVRPVDRKNLLREDEERAQDNTPQPFRFAVPRQTALSPGQGGITTRLSDGRRVWRVRIRSKGAYSLNFGFERFRLAPGARLFIYSPDRSHVLGAFTHRNNKPSGSLATTIVPGEDAVVELVEPKDKVGESELKLTRVSCAYRDIAKRAEKMGERGYGDSGNCNMNVNCPEGDPWDDQKRAVGLVISNGSWLCSGALVNNTLEDGTPYFLTANHCYANGSVSNWVFLFNYESPDCQDQQGPTSQSVSGATLRANNADSDFCLVEMSTQPPPHYEVYYAGWDHSGNVPDSTTCIHHPKGDIKKISFDLDPPGSTQFGSSASNAEWQIFQWDRNTTTESGSSGSPLFGQNKRVIGQLHGGQAQCGSSVNDYFGKFSVSWDRGGQPSTRLKDWLDPDNSGGNAIDGYDPNAIQYPNDGAVMEVIGVPDMVCGQDHIAPEVRIRNSGTNDLTSLTLKLLMNGVQKETYEWSGNLAPGAYDTVAFAQITLPDTVDEQKNALLVVCREPNGVQDQQPENDSLYRSFHLRSLGDWYFFNMRTDCSGSEVSWELKELDGDKVFYAEGPYTDVQGGREIEEEFCLVEDCYELLVEDAFGDGMSGASKPSCDIDGDYSLSDREGDVIVEMGDDPDFGDKATHPVILSPACNPEFVGKDVMVLYPNPSTGKVTLFPVGSTEGTYTLRLFDLRGRSLWEGELTFQQETSRELDFSAIRNGLYLLEIRGEQREWVRKLRLQR